MTLIERKKTAVDKYRASEKGKAKRKEYRASEQCRAKEKEKRSTVSYKEYMAAYLDKYQKRPNVKHVREQFSKGWRGKAIKLFRGMLTTSKKKNLGSVEWTLEEILTAIKGRACCKTGIPFALVVVGAPKNIRHPFAPSPDRRDNNKGYTKENTDWVCWAYNQMKGQATDQELEYFLTCLLEQKERLRDVA